MSKPIPYEQEKAMRLFMKLNPTGTELRLPGGGEVGIIQQAIEEVIREIKAECSDMHNHDIAFAAQKKVAASHLIYDRHNRLETQGAYNALLSQLDWHEEERARLLLIEQAARNLGACIDPHEYQEKMRRFEELNAALRD